MRPMTGAAGLRAIVGWVLGLGLSITAPAVASEGSGGAGRAMPYLGSAIEIQGLPSCVDEPTLEGRVAALLRPERINPSRHVQGTVESDGTGRVVQFRVFEGEELIGSRRLVFDSEDCAPFQEAVELVLAMLLEGHGFDEPTGPEAEAQPEEALPEEVLPSPPPAPPVPAQAKPQSKRRVRGHARLGGEFSVGVFPNASLGLRLEGGVEFKAPLALLARATWHMQGAIPVAGGGRLEFGGYRLAMQACYLHRPSWVLSLCAGMGYVSVRATGVDVPSGRSAGFDEAAAVFGVRFAVPLARAWSLEVGAELEAWFSRPEYVLLAGAEDGAEDGAEAQVLATASGVPVATWLALGYAF
jgi:hypothetical protein